MKYAKMLWIVLVSILFGVPSYRHYSEGEYPLYLKWNIASECSPLLSRLICDAIRPMLQFPGLVEKKVATLSKKYTSISNISVVYKNQHNIEIAITLYQPLVVINNDRVLCQNGNLAPLEWFDESCYGHLAAITSKKNAELISDQCFAWLVNNDIAMLSRKYKIIIHDHTKILLSSNDGKHTIICMADIPINQKMLDLCYKKIDLSAKSEFFRKRPRSQCGHVVADIRFDKRIILYHKMGDIV